MHNHKYRTPVAMIGGKSDDGGALQVIALCDDGTIWTLGYVVGAKGEWGWKELGPALPGTFAETPASVRRAIANLDVSKGGA